MKALVLVPEQAATLVAAREWFASAYRQRPRFVAYAKRNARSLGARLADDELAQIVDGAFTTTFEHLANITCAASLEAYATKVVFNMLRNEARNQRRRRTMVFSEVDDAEMRRAELGAQELIHVSSTLRELSGEPASSSTRAVWSDMEECLEAVRRAVAEKISSRRFPTEWLAVEHFLPTEEESVRERERQKAARRLLAAIESYREVLHDDDLYGGQLEIGARFDLYCGRTRLGAIIEFVRSPWRSKEIPEATEDDLALISIHAGEVPGADWDRIRMMSVNEIIAEQRKTVRSVLADKLAKGRAR